MSYYLSTNDIVEHYSKIRKFKPYESNGGGTVAIAGEDYAIIGSDSRLSVGYSIINRNQEKLFRLSDTSVLGASGCWADILTMSRLLRLRMSMYKHEHGKEISTPALAQMLSTILYYKRFFPYYIMNVLAGLDENGRGCVFNFDPVGHCERSFHVASGTIGPLLQPLLDNQIGKKNVKGDTYKPLEKEMAIALMKDGFTCAAERDVYTGNNLLIISITENGLQEEKFKLRKD